MNGPHASFVTRQRRLLASLDMIDRPWFVLGGAPDPTLPAGLAATHARVDINNSGRTAATLGLGRADLTMRRDKANWRAHPELDTRALMWFTSTPSALLHLRLMFKHRRARVGRLMRAQKHDRDALVNTVIGPEMASVGPLGKPSNGIVAACFGLYFGVPEVVLTGVSLTQDGHSFDKLGRPRKQVEEDTFALRVLAREPRMATTEPELAKLTGLRLWIDPAGL